jgi:hypothetical protein
MSWTSCQHCFSRSCTPAAVGRSLVRRMSLHRSSTNQRHWVASRDSQDHRRRYSWPVAPLAVCILLPRLHSQGRQRCQNQKLAGRNPQPWSTVLRTRPLIYRSHSYLHVDSSNWDLNMHWILPRSQVHLHSRDYSNCCQIQSWRHLASAHHCRTASSWMSIGRLAPSCLS